MVHQMLRIRPILIGSLMIAILLLRLPNSMEKVNSAVMFLKNAKKFYGNEKNVPRIFEIYEYLFTLQ